ncbi:aminotransferase class I/II-fold pyridoxal phosphate-dependent enzyme [Telmatospirillum siberiense]|uniref:Aminotransferase n=1 Tax=Telmatospirillum siberiense TaxID=382514 RepID=A0A2N3Q1K4_9PROT|nr:aminotransferase class I/II-fold pyridoxal phosphate-dependent enzyme [Telmatospirillum siberiense]PKU26539.1 aspartate aminotransferase [Telmatospirillum siberiense]
MTILTHPTQKRDPEIPLSRRARETRLPPNAAASLKAKALRAEGRDIIDLTIGEPDFDTPEHIKDAAIQAMRRGETKYTPAAGTQALRDAVSRKLARENELDYPARQIAIANGAKQIIFNAFAATLDTGDEVIIPTPAWSSFQDAAAFNDGTPRLVPCPASTGFKLTPEALERAITPKTRWLVLNSPSNPSGAVYNADELEALADVLRRHPQVLVLLDEIYEHVHFLPGPPASLTRVAPDLLDRILLITGVSKTYAMTGWRIGFGAGPLPLIKAMIMVQAQACSGVNAIAQAAAITALDGDQSFVERAAAAYKSRRDIVVNAFAGSPHIDLVAPDGGLFAFPSCASVIGRKTPQGRLIDTDLAFGDYLLETEGVASVNGGSFDLPGHFRLSIAADANSIEEACRRIARACARLG